MNAELPVFLNHWHEKFEGEITICDRDGIIIYMNEFSKKQFVKYGGDKLIGTNLLDCHPEPSRSKLVKLLELQETNSYTIEKGGIKKIIHQSPLFDNGIFNGLIEISFVLPQDMPHFNRG